MRIAPKTYRSLIYGITWECRQSKVDILTSSFGHGDAQEPIAFGVNWAALGTVSTEEAVDFADTIKLMAKVAEQLNDMRLYVDYNMSDMFETDDQFNEFAAKVSKAVRKGNLGYIAEQLMDADF